MDATQADIYLVSRLDRSEVIGRPYIYLAVDTATQLIAGVYVGMDAGEQAVINCLSNAAADKVSFCKRYGLDIKKEEWPNIGLPGEIITDKGREFIGTRMNELAMKYGIEFESLPPFRPDGKGLVEKSFDLIQQRYKPALRGKGVIEARAGAMGGGLSESGGSDLGRVYEGHPLLHPVPEQLSCDRESFL